MSGTVEAHRLVTRPSPDKAPNDAPASPGSATPSRPVGRDSEMRVSERAGRRRRWMAVGAAVLLLTIGIVVLMVRAQAGKSASARADQPSDVPRTDGNRVVFTDRFRERAGIKTATAKLIPLVPTLSVVGTATFSPGHTAAVGARVKGLVRRVIRFEGDEVREGDVLAEIESAELAEAQATASMLRAQTEAATLNANREKSLMDRQLSTAREFEESHADLKRYEALWSAARQKVAALGGKRNQGALGVRQLRAPMTGTVVERQITTGQSVEGDVIAYRIADLDFLWIELALYEKNLRYTRVDDEVELRPLNAPEEALSGRVKHIAARIDSLTRTAEVRVEIDNRNRKLRPGQSVTARIRATGGGHEPVIVVPSSAVTYVDGNPTVFVAEEPNTAVARPIELGQSNDREQQVLKGIRAGERIIAEGVFALKSELFR